MIEVEVEGLDTPLQFPDGTDPVVIQQAVKESLGIQSVPETPEIIEEQPTGEFIEGAGQSLLQGATLGFSDEIQSIIAASVASPFISDKTFSQLMVDARNSFREDQAKFEELNPKTSLGLEIAGGLATGGVGLAKGVGSVARQTIPRTIAKGAATGLAEGAIAGAGAADAETFLSADTALGSGTGAAIGSVAGGVLSGIVGKFAKGSALKKDIARRIEAGETDDDLAKFIVNGSGKLKADPIAQETIKQGFEDGVISAVKGSSPTDRAKMLRMVEVLEKGRRNKSFAVGNRPADVAGESLLSRFRLVRNVNREAGKEIDKAARSLRGQPADFSAPIEEFAQTLDDFGIKFSPDLKPDFTDSVLSPGDRGPIKEVLRQMKRIAQSGNPDAFQGHQLKKIIDNNVTFGKNKTGLGGDAARALKDFRRGLDGVLDSNFPSYNDANIKYSDTIQALDSLQDVAGRKMDLTGDNADKAVGTLLRRLMSNAQSRVNLRDSIESLNEAAQKYGGQFDDNIDVQMLFADELDRVFKPTARTSFAGQIGQEVERAANQSASQTALGTMAKTAGKIAENVRGIDEKNALLSIKELLKAQ